MQSIKIMMIIIIKIILIMFIYSSIPSLPCLCAYVIHTQNLASLHFNACSAPFQGINSMRNAHNGGGRKISFQHVLKQRLGRCIQ